MADEQNTEGTPAERTVQHPPVGTQPVKHYLGRGRISTNREELLADKSAPAVRSSQQPKGQPVSQPSAPGVGIPSGLADSRPVGTQGRLMEGSLKDALSGTTSAAEEEDDEEESSEYDDMDKDELEEEAKDRGLEVKRLDGRDDRKPRKEDLIAALVADDEANEDDEEEEESEE